MSTIKNMTAYDVADLNGIFGTVGAGNEVDAFFEGIRDYADEAIDENTEDGEIDGDAAKEMAREMIDGSAFLIYTSQVWEIYTDLRLYNSDFNGLDSDYDADTMTQLAAQGLAEFAFMVADDLVDSAVEWAEDEKEA